MESMKLKKTKVQEITIQSTKLKILYLLFSYILLIAVSILSKGFGLGSFLFYMSLVLSATLFFAGYFLLYRDIKYFQELKRILDKYTESNNTFHPVLKNTLNDMSEGDFSKAIELESNDIEKLGENRGFFDSLKSVMEKIKTSNTHNQKISFGLVGSVQTLLEAYNIQASASSEQASSVAEITATMEELARTAAQIAENSNKVAAQANSADKAAREGFGLINTVIYRIEKIDKKMDQISQKTQILGTQSKEIGKVLEIIHDISNETHLLALNAAIESVSAGEYGKRFGVIAAEVRRLAEISRENAETIKKSIDEFQNSIDTTILAIDEGTKMTSEVNVTSQEISSHLNSITDNVAETSQSASEISLATQQQRTASDQIVLTLKEISLVTKQQAGELKKSSTEIKRLSLLALNHQILTQHIIIDSPFSLGHKIQKIASLPEITGMNMVEHNQILEKIIDENQFLELIFIAGKDGKLCSYSINKHNMDIEYSIEIGEDVASRPWFFSAIGSDYPYISNVYKSAFSKEDCFTVSNCIKNEKNEVIGVVAIDINTKEWTKIIT